MHSFRYLAVLAAAAGLTWGVFVMVPSPAPAQQDAEAGNVKLADTQADADAKPHGSTDHPSKSNPLSVDPDLAIWTGIVFLLMLAFLTKFAWKPIAHGLEQRERSISDKIDEANQNFAKASEQLKIYEQKLATAADEARQMIDTARKDAEAVGERIRNEAQEQARRERDRAIADIQAAKSAAIQEVAQQGASLAVSLAGQIVKREVKSQDHARLINESLQNLARN